MFTNFVCLFYKYPAPELLIAPKLWWAFITHIVCSSAPAGVAEWRPRQAVVPTRHRAAREAAWNSRAKHVIPSGYLYLAAEDHHHFYTQQVGNSLTF